MEELDDFFKNHETAGSRVIIFTEFVNLPWKLFNVLKRQMIIENRIFSLVSQRKEKFDVENFGKKKQKGQTKKKKDERPSTRSSSENAQMTGMSQNCKGNYQKFKKVCLTSLLRLLLVKKG